MTPFEVQGLRASRPDERPFPRDQPAGIAGADRRVQRKRPVPPFCETPLRSTFDNPDDRNDFAVWSKLYLGDRVLAERLGILDPYEYSSLGELRGATLEVIDERLGNRR